MKKLLILTVVSALMLTMGTISAAAAAAGAHIFVDGVPIKAKSVNKNGVSFVPFRELFERLGMGIGFDSRLKQVTGTKKDLKLTFTLGSKTAYVNGTKKALQAAPFSQNGTTYIPVRIVGESTGNTVYWSPKANLIQINSPSFKGARYTVDGIPVVINKDGSILMGPDAAKVTHVENELAERESIDNYLSSSQVVREIGVPPTEAQSKEPGYKGYPDYFDLNYTKEGKTKGDLPPLMSKGWISLAMLSEIENINRLSTDNPNIITLGRAIPGAFGLFKYDIVLTEEYKKATKGDFVLSKIRVKKYKGTMYLNIEDLKKAEVIYTEPENPQVEPELDDDFEPWV
ncbi:copper amine oxidase N-terminal domain-containing protein [Paenibacillus sp. GCM10027626]|uniref:copper amine oxidase N-terminal domain-containing protein n=1 Tax=Paenibacillus sp. GCM10027626 TaxID=3273411 RepID=UPI00363CA722